MGQTGERTGGEGAPRSPDAAGAGGPGAGHRPQQVGALLRLAGRPLCPLAPKEEGGGRTELKGQPWEHFKPLTISNSHPPLYTLHDPVLVAISRFPSSVQILNVELVQNWKS